MNTQTSGIVHILAIAALALLGSSFALGTAVAPFALS